VGVGQKPHPDYDLASWVLSEFRGDELKALEGTFPTVCEGLETILSATIDDAMQICNKKQ
jgi:PTH1 family peptidyl-tRNA hydrolase